MTNIELIAKIQAGLKCRYDENLAAGKKVNTRYFSAAAKEELKAAIFD